MSREPPDRPLLTVNDLCNLLKVCRATLYNRLKRGLIPKPARIGTKPYWTHATIQAYLAKPTTRRATRRPAEESQAQ
jgi:predicted DNA-binding transcriptional regulator AlpA